MSNAAAAQAIEPQAEACRIPLARGQFALLDANDAERAGAHRWYLKTKKSTPGKYYVQRSFRAAGRNASESLHRFVMGCVPGDGKVVDHRNGNGLDNRKVNLRVTDARGNATNVTSSKRQKLGTYKGVSWNPAMGKWQASICAGEIKPNGKRRQLYLGCFTDPADAARAYDTAARQHFGEFASLNFDPAWLGPSAPPAVAANFTFLQADLGGVAP